MKAKCKCKCKCKCGKLFLKLLFGVCTLFIGTFLVYLFNLDMKLTAMMEPIMLKHYDRIDRDKRL